MKFNLVIILSVLQFCGIIGLSTSVIEKGHCNFTDYDQDVLNCYNFRMADINKFTFQKIRPDKIHVNIKRLHFVDSHFDFFTTIFFGYFYGSLKSIKAYDCGITNITDESFRNVPNMTHLDLQSNAIKKLRSKSFYNLKKLKDLNLANNLIETIEIETFENLTRLEKIYLDNNKLKFIKSNTFYMIKNIKYLNLRNNQINGELILNVKKIEVLSAYNCSLTRFTVSVNSDEIKQLSLASNNLKEVSLAEVKVKELYLTNNKIKRIDNIYGSELIELYLNGNPLDYDNSVNDFHNMAKLETLSLVNTNLLKLNKDMFKSMSNLKYLDVSGNPLRRGAEIEGIKEIPNLRDCTITWPTKFTHTTDVVWQ